MTDFRDFFTKHAESYSKSKSHAKGKDLAFLVELLSGMKFRKALDIATGTGFTAIAISEFCEEVVALDATPAMLEQAKKNASESASGDNISFVIGTAENTGFPDESFDLVTCRRAAHHFADKIAFLNEVKRVLKKDGILAIVDMVSPENDTGHYLDALETYRDPSHKHAASLNEWKSLIEGSGLKLEGEKTERDDRAFGEWLSPVSIDSENGLACVDYVKNNRDALISAGVWNPDGDLFIKYRSIIIARKTAAAEE